MKKIIIFILLTVLSLGMIDTPNSQAYFRVVEDSKHVEYVDGIKHTKIVGTINSDGVESRQVINYLGANIKTNTDINIVVGDNYKLHQDENDIWGMSNILGLIDNVHSRYANFEVLAGVNGDFYDINYTGRPVSAHIRNYEIITRGDTTSRPLVGFKENGDVVFGKPEFDGYELLVYNDEGQLKNKLKVDNINSDPSNNNEISVYFDNYLNALPSDLNKVFINATETKITDYKDNYFAKGIYNELEIQSENIEENQFVIVGYEFNDDDLISESDLVIVQLDIINKFEDVQFAIGTDSQPLVIDGEPNVALDSGAAWNYTAPRTAVGIKEDGTVFFVVVDGRNFNMGMEGVKLREMGEIMAYFGAENAFNLDGGGSSTMALKDLEAGGYMILNTPSDGRLRAISNGVFFVKGEQKVIPDPIPTWPDLRDQLDIPTNLFVDQENILRFNNVIGSISYSVVIDGVETIITNNQLELELSVGIHEISVRAKGGTEFKSSTYSSSFFYQVYPHEINLLIDMIKDFTKSELRD